MLAKIQPHGRESSGSNHARGKNLAIAPVDSAAAKTLREKQEIRRGQKWQDNAAKIAALTTAA